MSENFLAPNISDSWRPGLWLERSECLHAALLIDLPLSQPQSVDRRYQHLWMRCKVFSIDFGVGHVVLVWE